jgi:hypothetical protein
MVKSTTTTKAIRDARPERGDRQAATWPMVGVDARYARHVGRVGALAVALGVCIAVASGFGAGTGVAWADQESGTSDNSPTGDAPTADPPSADASSADAQSVDAGDQAPGSSSDGQGTGETDADDEGIDADGAMNVEASGGLDNSANDGGQSTDTEDEGGNDAVETPEPQPQASAETVTTPATTPPEMSEKSSHKNDSVSALSTGASIPHDTTSQEAVSASVATLDSVEPGPAGSSDAPGWRVDGLKAETTSRLAIVDDSSVTPPQEPAGLPGALIDFASKVVTAVFSQLLSLGTQGPAEQPFAWTFLAFARREIDSLLGAHEPIAAQSLNSLAVEDPPAPTAAAAANSAPTAVPDSASATRNIARTFTAAQLVGNDTDPDIVNGDALKISSVAGAINGKVVQNADGTVTFTPTTNFSGPASFTYRVADTAGAVSANSAKVSITVVADRAPTAVPDSATIAKNVARTFTAAQLMGNDTDPDIANGDTLKINVVIAPTNGKVVKNADGTVTFTPTTNYSGPASFTYRVEDSQRRLSNYAKVSITVAGNQAPTAVPDSATITRNVARTFTAAQLVGNDTDPEGDALNVSSVSGAVNGTVIKNTNGTVTFTPTANYSGPASFTYRVADTSGAVSANSATVSITVAANQAPTAVADSVTVNKDVARTFTAAQLVGNDTDPEGDALNVSSVSGAVSGTVIKNTDGTVTFTPTANYSGPASFTYRVADTSGAVSANSATVSVTVVNTSSPVASNDAFGGREDSPVTGNVLTNDTGALNASLGTAATYGSVSFNPNGSFTYTPNANFHGTDTFTYTASNSGTNSTPATVTLTVTPVDDVVFQFNYGTGSQYWTPAARGALEAAANRVSEYIVTATPVTITYNVTGINDPSSGYLAWAGTSVPSTAPGFYDSVTAKKIQSATHIDGNGATADGDITWNFAYPYEYADDQALNENDFQTVAMHELMHTLGFLSFVGPAGSNTNQYWFAYDKFIVNSAGARVIGDDFRFNTAYNSNLSGANGGLYFGGPNAVAVYGGPVPVHAGSEDHLRGATFTGTNRKLMTPTITTGKTLRTISPVEMAILKDLGYTVVTPTWTSAPAMAGATGQSSPGPVVTGTQSGARGVGDSVAGDSGRHRDGGHRDTALFWLVKVFRVADSDAAARPR